MTDDIISSVMKTMAEEEAATPAAQPEAKPAAPALRKRRSSTDPSKNAMRWNLPGFDGKAKVTTSFGDLPIAALRLRDPVKTISGAYMKVEWLDRIYLDEGFLNGFQDANPVRFQRGALGLNAPFEAVTLSPGQNVAFKREGARTRPVKAGTLCNRPNIDRLLSTNVTYFMFHCGEPTLVQVNGMWCAVAP
ncbi:Hint domain-containing protein [Alisedimentitalea sp. MJ-SS2]|uniref:Hint domain-containing protein n=1 Tax=Aliisedimentitalea sp. MJ-SS2 TaxID=3049795 RepID=UPI002911343D|nr:Hint domain-containing protein [Alisedimentitalea sp. MJ-SS2]MDU8927527.1 Hint domain-containing protein [Alisedimentitalea sp. MJ-SS2]